MDCQDMGSKLSALMDHELTREEELKLKKHLEQCQKCMLGLEDMRKVWNLMGKMDDIEPSPYFWDTLHPKFIAQKKSPFTKSGQIARSIWNTLKGLFVIPLKPTALHTFSLDVFNDFPPGSFGQLLYPTSLNRVKLGD
ncbi:MAG: zf-HC2 domain-containing protein [Deltaproteobacteria bacterium]|nr:zf-HC2 domain-containing protein [Deltaproteobacteria bacterium]